MSTSVPPPGYESPPTPAPAVVVAPAITPRRPRAAKLLGGLLSLAAAVGVVLVMFSGASSPVTDPIAQAATRSSSAPGFRMHLSMTMSMPALSTPVTASGDASVDLRDHAASMSFGIDFSQLPQVASVLGSSTMRMDMILDGGAAYIKLPQAIMDHVPGFRGKRWVGLNFAKMGGLPGLSSLGNDPTISDPSRMLQYLRAASNGVADEGQQQVDGVETTHYHAVLSLDRAAAQIPAAARGVVERALARLRQSTHQPGIPVDVWIDAHHLVRRIMMSMSVSSAGLTVHETVIADITDYGVQPRPAAPPANQVEDLGNLIHVQG